MIVRRVILISVFVALCSVMCFGASPRVPASLTQTGQVPDYCIDTSSSDFDPDQFLSLFLRQPIADATFARMKDNSYPSDCPIRRSDLCYLFVPHYDGHGSVRIGEMVCNKAIADDLLDIFRALFLKQYPIERMVLIDEYGGDDELSMTHNNTSCFNYRRVPGRKTLSRHARGMAIDINPLYNPYVRASDVRPSKGVPYADRSRTDIPFKITASDPACLLFRSHGFTWGGNWRHSKDYQHFQKP
ncbi:MAG: M15 family metallopeptidase [Bacteroides sp.]|nr:M15 family metallopeptidase [Bacteroides sp.]MCM1413040.1 M15 family metallopeptidase [Bacteroides sp.]MCM1471746.1 M15 family metallopeptidase [Bacteroides sp.]